MGLKRLIKKIVPSLYAMDRIMTKCYELEKKIDNANYKNELLLLALGKLENEDDLTFKQRMFASIPKATGDMRLVQLCNNYILKKIKNVCDANNIQFFLDSGTLLGAVRHHGFIPWDDDIDILMTSAQYDKFVNAMKDNTELEAHNYYVGSNYGFIRKVKLKQFQYLFVDIFIIEEISAENNEDLNDVYTRTQNQCIEFHNDLQKLFMADKQLAHMKMGAIHIPQLDGQVDALIMKYRKTLPYGKNAMCPAIDDYPLFRMHRNVLPYSTYFPSRKMLFEGVEYDVPNDYDYVLKQIYGDYWTFPKTLLPCHENDIGSHINEIKKIAKEIGIVVK